MKSIFLWSNADVMFQNPFNVLNELGGLIFYGQLFRRLLSLLDANMLLR